jgi:serine O-acetyltransferase
VGTGARKAFGCSSSTGSARWCYGIRPAILRNFFSLLYKIAFKSIQIVTGVELPCEVEIGRNFVIDHFGGIVISGYARFGDDCRIRNGVVVGLRRVDEPRAPVIGDNVDIGAGAKILGPISIGNNVATARMPWCSMTYPIIALPPECRP